MAARQTPTLNLDTLFQGAPITIDRMPYEIRHPDALSLDAYKQLEEQLPRFGHLMSMPAKKRTKEQSAEATALLNEIVDVILDAPDEVRARLKVTQRILVMNVFTRLRPDVLTSLIEAQNAPKPTRQRTGAKSSRR